MRHCESVGRPGNAIRQGERPSTNQLRAPNFEITMTDSASRRLWPFGMRVALLSVPSLLLLLLVVVAVIRQKTRWLGPELDRTVLLGILIVSFLPIILAVLDFLAERRGVLEYKGLKLDFSRVITAQVSFPVPQNVGVPGRAVSDSDTTQILDALRGALTSEVAVVDLERGGAWWETRLLVLLEGAVRLDHPSALVFVAIEEAIPGMFIGWAPPDELLPLLLHADPRYKESYARAKAAAHQWELVEPRGAGQAVPPLPWMHGLALQHQWMAFDAMSGLPNRFALEQFLAADLGANIEVLGQAKSISVIRLRDLFGSVLRTSPLDETLSAQKQIETILTRDDKYVAVTQDRRYVKLVPRIAVLSGIVRSMIKEREAGG
jgi:hypothetical protein